MRQQSNNGNSNYRLLRSNKSHTQYFSSFFPFFFRADGNLLNHLLETVIFTWLYIQKLPHASERISLGTRYVYATQFIDTTKCGALSKQWMITSTEQQTSKKKKNSLFACRVNNILAFYDLFLFIFVSKICIIYYHFFFARLSFSFYFYRFCIAMLSML